jgi:hypothetical protein
MHPKKWTNVYVSDNQGVRELIAQPLAQRTLVLQP